MKLCKKSILDNDSWNITTKNIENSRSDKHVYVILYNQVMFVITLIFTIIEILIKGLYLMLNV